MVLPYFKGILEKLELERYSSLEELKSLQENLEQIKQVVTMQLSKQSSLGMLEQLDITVLVESALNLQNNKITQNNIRIVRNYEHGLVLGSIKSKIQQILVNLVKNAIEALIESDSLDKLLTITIKQPENKVLHLSIADNGVGVLNDNRDKIFNFGYTTKKQGHGFGLHSCALLAKELGGALTVESEGLQRGTVFKLEIPDLSQSEECQQKPSI